MFPYYQTCIEGFTNNEMFTSHLAGPLVLLQVHSDDAGNARGHVMPAARALPASSKCTALKHLWPAKCDNKKFIATFSIQ